MDDLVELGRTAGAYGFHGWVRIVPFESGEVLEKTRNWVLLDMRGTKTAIKLLGVQRHGSGLIAKWEGCETKEDADLLRAKICVSRSEFPDAGKDAVWAIDIIGSLVRNKEGVELGTVQDIGSNGAQDLLVISYQKEDGQAAQFMIPNIKDVYVFDIDIDKQTVLVDWQAEWR